MAKIHEELIVVKISKLIKDTDGETAQIAGTDIVAGLEAVVQEMVGEGVIVEVIKE